MPDNLLQLSPYATKTWADACLMDRLKNDRVALIFAEGNVILYTLADENSQKLYSCTPGHFDSKKDIKFFKKPIVDIINFSTHKPGAIQEVRVGILLQDGVVSIFSLNKEKWLYQMSIKTSMVDPKINEIVFFKPQNVFFWLEKKQDGADKMSCTVVAHSLNTNVTRKILHNVPMLSMVVTYQFLVLAFHRHGVLLVNIQDATNIEDQTIDKSKISSTHSIEDIRNITDVPPRSRGDPGLQRSVSVPSLSNSGSVDNLIKKGYYWNPDTVTTIALKDVGDHLFAVPTKAQLRSQCVCSRRVDTIVLYDNTIYRLNAQQSIPLLKINIDDRILKSPRIAMMHVNKTTVLLSQKGLAVYRGSSDAKVKEYVKFNLSSYGVVFNTSGLFHVTVISPPETPRPYIANTHSNIIHEDFEQTLDAASWIHCALESSGEGDIPPLEQGELSKSLKTPCTSYDR